MQIPIIQRVPTPVAATLTAALMIFQWVNGTSLPFVTMTGAYISLFILAFNRAGGFGRPLGVLLFQMAFTNVLLAQCVKIALGQAADTNLRRPLESIQVQTIGMACVAAASFVPKMRIKYFDMIMSEFESVNFRLLSVACFVLSLLVLLLGGSEFVRASRVLSGIVSYLGFLPSLGFAAETMHVVKESNGRRSTSWLQFGTLLLIWIPAVFVLSKQGILTPIVLYLLVCLSTRFNFKTIHFIGFSLLLTLTAIFLETSKLGHNFLVEQHGDDMIGGVWALVENIIDSNGVINDYGLNFNDPETWYYAYYGKDMGIIDRWSLMASGDYLIDYTLKNGMPAGAGPFWDRFSLLPRSLFGEKYDQGIGNFLARRSGAIAFDDRETGISFGIFPDAFAYLGWIGMIPVLFLAFGAFIWAVQSAFPTMQSLSAILAVGMLGHSLAETSVTSLLFSVFRTIPFLLITQFLITRLIVLATKFRAKRV